jgi:hypothetical protein
MLGDFPVGRCLESVLAQRAPSMNFLWLDTMPETPRGIAFLRTGLGGELSNAMTGSGAGCEVTPFDFEYETGLTARTERTHAQTIAAFRSAHSNGPTTLNSEECIRQDDLRPQRNLGASRR